MSATLQRGTLPKMSLNKSQSKTYISTTSLLQRRSISFRAGKGGFKIARYQNTYHLESINKFNCEIVDKILKDVMQNYLTDLKYHPQICMQICQRISTEVRDKITKKIYDRYKIMVIVSIVQKLGQSAQINFGKLWDVQRDTYSSYVIETPEFAAMGLVVGIYYE